MPFNRLQQRLNRKTPAKSHLRDYPAFVRVYDMLFDGAEDIRDLPLADRRQRLEGWIAAWRRAPRHFGNPALRRLADLARLRRGRRDPRP